MPRAALILCLLAFAAGCGGDEEPEAEAQPAASPAAAEQATVAIEEFTFVPGDITVSAGAKVTWSNADASNHNVVFDDEAQKGIPNIREGQKGTATFSEAGSFSYVCSYHPGMEGTVVVE